MIFPRASRQNPCPICGKTDWCQFGDRAIKCMRVESDHPDNAGGWWHFTHERIIQAPPPRKTEQPAIEAGKMMREWRTQTKTFQFAALAQSLGVLPESLIGLGAAWAKPHNAWAFAMRDGYGETIGIRLRNIAGSKWSVAGSRQGVFLPETSVRTDKVVYLPEGPTDTAALLSMGLFAIGRPNNMCGAAQIKTALKRLRISLVVVVCDSDQEKMVAGKLTRPGVSGAQKFKAELGVKSCIWFPPSEYKDVRGFYKAGGTRESIEADIKNKIWNNK